MCDSYHAELHALRHALRALTEDGGIAVPRGAEIQLLTDSLFTRFRDVSAFSIWFRKACAFFPLVLMFRLFKAFDAQPRLALVTRTLRAAAAAARRGAPLPVSRGNLFLR